MEPLEAPEKHEHQRRTDGDEAKVREYGKLVLFIMKHTKIFSALAFGAWSVYTTIQTLKAEILTVRADVVMVKADTTEVKKAVAETQQMVQGLDRKIEKLSRRGDRDTYGSTR